MSVVSSVKGEASQQARSLYRQLLRQGGQFAAYNFREYAKRRTSDSFREHKDVQDERKIQELMQNGLKELQSLKRQTVVSQFFQLDKLVVEGGKTGKQSGKRNDIYAQLLMSSSISFTSQNPPSHRHYDESETDHNSTKLFVIKADDSARTSDSRLEDQSEPILSSPVAIKVSPVATVSAAAPKSRIIKLRLDPTLLWNIENSSPSSHSFIETSQNIDMPAYRTGGRRQNRTGYVDHDILEGVPVRQWRREFVTVAPPPPQESIASQNDIWASELPLGMPKDSHLLSQHSQELLRAARSGRIYKRPASMDEKEQDLEAILGDKLDKKEDELKDSGFTARAWKQIPGHQNASDMNFLAKRRKGLVSAVSKQTPVPTVVQTTIRRTDAAGNEYLEKIIVPHGQIVVGDVVSQTTIPDPNAAEGTPFRRKGPVGKKGRRGPGRGRKKIMPTSAPHITSEPAAQNGDASISNLEADRIKIEGEGSTPPVKNFDTEMVDDSNPASDDDDGDEGDQGDEDDDPADVSNSPSRPHRDSSQDHPMSTMLEIPKLSSADVMMGGTDNYGPTKSELERVKDEGRFGSPLKQIALTTSTVNTPMVSPTETTIREPKLFPAGNNDNGSSYIESIHQEMLSVVDEFAPSELPPVPPHPTEEHEEVSIELRAEEEREEEMLLDILENEENAQIGAAFSVEIDSPFLAIPASIQSPAKALDPPPAEAKSPQNDTVPSPVPSPIHVVEEPPTVHNLATASSGSPIKERPVALSFSVSPSKDEKQPVTSTSPPSAVPEPAVLETAEHVEPAEYVETAEPAEPAEPTKSTELNGSNETKVSNVVNEPNTPDDLTEPANPTFEEEDDNDFLDLLGGLERNLYGNSQPPAASPAPAPALASIALVQPNPIEDNSPTPKDVEGDTNPEEKEKSEDIKEEIPAS
ncbi:hypothetical protein SBOR_8655 [Sclerotinia borealis F-4128]|uniref:Complex 1 LYR protein domain-containing protein n=1 Tax=Sclerotinia borealis (strain F-4128) TaxID=1432307 RepID=W9C2F0_SCLBF|nr:hypothetical protein SBOR_8655 [Sclerotinia borealis F-4128]